MKLILYMLLSGLALPAFALQVSEELFLGDYSPAQHEKMAKKTISILQKIECASGVTLGRLLGLYQSLAQVLTNENLTDEYNQCLMCSLPQRSIALQLAQDSGCEQHVSNFMAKIPLIEHALDSVMQCAFDAQQEFYKRCGRSYDKKDKHILYVFGMRHTRAYMESWVKKLLLPFVGYKSCAMLRGSITYTLKGLASPVQHTLIKADRDAICCSLKRVIAEKGPEKNCSLVQSHRYLLELIEKSSSDIASRKTVNGYAHHLYKHILPFVHADKRYKNALSVAQEKVNDAQRALHELLKSVAEKTSTVMRDTLSLDDQEYAALQDICMCNGASALSEIDARPITLTHHVLVKLRIVLRLACRLLRLALMS